MSDAWAANVDVLVSRLTNPAYAEPPSGFPRDREMVNSPGLYSWWADEAGLDDLSMPFCTRLPALIYAGQAGATSTRSRTVRLATLCSRIGDNHLKGNIGSSTFRKTLTAILLESLDLRMQRRGCLDAKSNAAVSDWIRAHLRVVVAPCTNRHGLAEVEHTVLTRIDPPLNLMGMPATPVREKLRQLRRQLR